MSHHRLAAFATGIVALATAAEADVILDWNQQLVQTVRETGGPPGPLARSFAIMHGAMYDSVNSITRTHNPLKFQLDAPDGTSIEAAAAAAAHRVLTALYSEQNFPPAQFPNLDRQRFDLQLTQSLSTIPNSPGKAAGIQLGQSIADMLVANRATDRSDATMTYIPRSEPGHWRPVAPDFLVLTPTWGDVEPWTMADGWQELFRAPPPPPVSSQQYADAFAEVKSVGRADSTTRTPEQTTLAYYWANDRDGSHKPPGQLNDITRAIAQSRGNTLEENARLFALVNVGLADAAVVAWDTKYPSRHDTPLEGYFDYWRPDAAIRAADSDGNDNTHPDPDWIPLADVAFPNGDEGSGTPAFPAYTSGHATFAATHAEIVRQFYGFFGDDVDDLAFQVPSDDLPGPGLLYTSLKQAALDNAESRIFLGVHWRFDAEQALIAGTALGQYVMSIKLLPIPEPSSLTLAALAATGLLALRRRRG